MDKLGTIKRQERNTVVPLSISHRRWSDRKEGSKERRERGKEKGPVSPVLWGGVARQTKADVLRLINGYNGNVKSSPLIFRIEREILNYGSTNCSLLESFWTRVKMLANNSDPRTASR